MIPDTDSPYNVKPDARHLILPPGTAGCAKYPTIDSSSLHKYFVYSAERVVVLSEQRFGPVFGAQLAECYIEPSGETALCTF
jgi:hypothetical protein